MTQSKESLIPEWIKKSIAENKNSISAKSLKFFQKTEELSPFLNNAFLEIDHSTKLLALKTYNLNDLSQEIKKDRLIEFLLLSIYEEFQFKNVYQIRELLLTLKELLHEGRFYPSVLILRSLLEIVCVDYYSFSRVDSELKLSLATLDRISKTKSKIERDTQTKKYAEGAYKIFMSLFNSKVGSSINWDEYMATKNISKNDIGHKSIHVLSAIEDAEKKSKLPLTKIYALLSEFVHPNAGSKMLIVNTRIEKSKCIDELVIGNNKNNSESALFFIDYLSESFYYTLSLSCSLRHRADQLGEKIAMLNGIPPIPYPPH